MKRISRIRFFVSILVFFLLFSSIVYSSINSLGFGAIDHVVVANKKPTAPSKSGIQLPEKVESENDHKANNNFFFIHKLGEFLRFDITRSQHNSFYNTFCLRASTKDTPLYLIKRSILI